MKNSKILLNEIVERIHLDQDMDEVKSIASILLENIFGLTMTDIVAGKEVELTTEASLSIDRIVQRVNEHEPVQYVLGQAVFYGRVFSVNPSVLIPRPETEELVGTVLKWKNSGARPGSSEAPRILDIGTGSGCISVTLSLEWPGSQVMATDVSVEAIAVARTNAKLHAASVAFLEHDILREDIHAKDFEVIVSNPPYIAESERNSMRQNVLDFEPHVALFVLDDDPLVFYRTIAKKARTSLIPGGLLAFEINERYGNEVCQLLIEEKYKKVSLSRDISGKPRVVTGIM